DAGRKRGTVNQRVRMLSKTIPLVEAAGGSHHDNRAIDAIANRIHFPPGSGDVGVRADPEPETIGVHSRLARIALRQPLLSAQDLLKDPRACRQRPWSIPPPSTPPASWPTGKQFAARTRSGSRWNSSLRSSTSTLRTR